MTSGLTLAIILQTLGVLVIVAEFLLPSAGILTVTAIALFGYSLYHVFTHIGPMAGMTFVIADAIIIPVVVIFGLKLLARSPATLKTTLSSADGVVAQSASLDAFLNKEGVASSNLRPSGMALIDGKRLDVVTRGDYVERNTPVIVIAVEGNQVIVRRKEAGE